jgi:ADP-heptose:LPS heptosyltransferase
VFPVKKIAFRAKKMGISLRIGTTNRIYHWITCNELIKLSRKKSNLHEAQLNLKLLKGLGIDDNSSLDEIGISFGLKKIKPLENAFSGLLQEGKYNLILHPKSQGSAREWGLNNFVALINSLDESHFNIFISGTQKERVLLQPLFDAVGNRVNDITGIMNLDQFISFINHCDGLVANSTGPLHIAAAVGKDALGIYPPIRPMHPGRWAPLGPNAKIFVLNKFCEDCRKRDTPCICIASVKPEWIVSSLKQKI